MKKTLLKSSLFLFSILFANSIFSQSNDWELYYSDNQIKIEYTYQNCEYTEQFNSEYVVFKITNTTNQNITVEWQEQLWYDDICSNCEQDNIESRKIINLEAEERLEGECNINSNLKIFSKFLDKIEDLPILGVKKIATLSRFELKNITIK
jgi:hypothetical protein